MSCHNHLRSSDGGLRSALQISSTNHTTPTGHTTPRLSFVYVCAVIVEICPGEVHLENTLLEMKLTLVASAIAASNALHLPLRPPAATVRTSTPSMLFGGGGKEGEGGPGGMGNMMETIKKAQAVGVKVKELQEELQETEIEAVAANGGVTVVISGAQVPISVEVTDELLKEGPDAVSAAVSAAAKDAHTNSMEYAKQRMTELYQ